MEMEKRKRVAFHTPLSVVFSYQEYWSGLPCPPPGDRPYPGFKSISTESPALEECSLPTETPGKSFKSW